MSVFSNQLFVDWHAVIMALNLWRHFHQMLRRLFYFELRLLRSNGADQLSDLAFLVLLTQFLGFGFQLLDLVLLLLMVETFESKPWVLRLFTLRQEQLGLLLERLTSKQVIWKVDLRRLGLFVFRLDPAGWRWSLEFKHQIFLLLLPSFLISFALEVSSFVRRNVAVKYLFVQCQFLIDDSQLIIKITVLAWIRFFVGDVLELFSNAHFFCSL